MESARIVAALTRRFGPSNLDLVQDAVQEAFLRAMTTWPNRGTPLQPGAWLHRTAERVAIDALRRTQRLRPLKDLDESVICQSSDLPADGFSDDELRMLFLCTHPALSAESSLVLTLQTLGGLSVAEIARATFSRPEAVSQRIVRAKRRLAELDAPFEIPPEAGIADRLDGVLRVLYLIFNEGYSATRGARVQRDDLVQEALSLGHRLAGTRLGNRPEVHALLSLMWFQTSRHAARQVEDVLLPLAEQDRTKWDWLCIRRGYHHLDRASTGLLLTAYHVQAAIASIHASAKSFADTDWPALVAQYDELLRISPGVIVQLNRLVALSYSAGPSPAWREFEELPIDARLERYVPRHAVEGFLRERNGDPAGAAACFERAAELSQNEPEARLLRQRAAATGRGIGVPPMVSQGVSP